MSDNPESDVPPETEEVTWAEFLMSIPFGQKRRVSDLVKESYPAFAFISKPVLELYCDHESCGRIGYFDSTSGSIEVDYKDWAPTFIVYKCRHCRQVTKYFSVLIKLQLNQSKVSQEAFKIGELPPFGPNIPTRLNKFLGTDRNYFFKGARAESQGMGVAAFAYYNCRPKAMNRTYNR